LDGEEFGIIGCLETDVVGGERKVDLGPLDAGWHVVEYPEGVVKHHHYCCCAVKTVRIRNILNQMRTRVKLTVSKILFEPRIEMCFDL